MAGEVNGATDSHRPARPIAATAAAKFAAGAAAIPVAEKSTDCVTIESHPPAERPLSSVVDAAKAAQAAAALPPAESFLDRWQRRLQATSKKLAGANDSIQRGAQSFEKGVKAGCDIVRGTAAVASVVQEAQIQQARAAGLLPR